MHTDARDNSRGPRTVGMPGKAIDGSPHEPISKADYEKELRKEADFQRNPGPVPADAAAAPLSVLEKMNANRNIFRAEQLAVIGQCEQATAATRQQAEQPRTLTTPGHRFSM